jgi:threonine dehydratase
MFEGKRVGFICSGANVDPSKFSDALSLASVGAYKRRYLEIAVPEGRGSLLDLLETYFKDVNVQDFQYGKKYNDEGFPIIGFEAPEPLMDELVSRLKQDGYKANDVSNAVDVRDRAVNCEVSLLRYPILMNVDFPERKGALREFMGSVSGVANLCYFNYEYAGDNTGHALMGFEFESLEQRNEFLSRAAIMDVVTCKPVDEDAHKRVFGHAPQQRTTTTGIDYQLG